MKELGIAIEGGLLMGCAWLLVALCFCALACRVWRGWKIFKRKRKAMALGLLACAAIIVGGTKNGMVTTMNDPYITVDGSYTTNEWVHVEVQKRYDWVPDTTEVWIWSRELAQTNAEDWVRLVRAEEGEYRITEFPMDIPFPNATNYDFLVAANYIPEPTVHTNGVWQIKGFVVPGTETETQTGVYAFPNTKTTLKETP